MVASALKELKLKLDREEAWDEDKRMKYKDKWARPSSDSLN